MKYVLKHVLKNEEIHTLEFLRSEAEQLIGHELIKNLGKLKQMVVALLSPR
jgi:tetrahydromethanopterin S-methyltransferase subunit G